jgi:type I restriction enzyme, S subunit
VTLAIKTGSAPADDISESSPEGWMLTPLGDACEINPPKAPKDSLPADASVTFVPMPAVDAAEGAITKPQVKRFAEVRKGFTSFRENDVIMAKITPCMENGKAAIARDLVNGQGFGSTEFHVFRSTGAVLPEFIYHFIRRDVYRRAAEAEMTGSVGQKRVPQTFLETTELPLPPLSEQQRIVASLTELLNTVKSSQEKLNRVPAMLKRFRRAVLAAACAGKLTEDWRAKRGKIESAASRWNLGELAPLQSDSLPELPESWVYRRLDDISERVSVGHVGPTSQHYCSKEVGVPFVRSQNVRPGKLEMGDAMYITPTFQQSLKKSQLQAGDLLIVRVGANRGDSCIVPCGIGPLNCANIIFARPFSGISYYLEAYCQSTLGQTLLLGMTTGSAQGVINTTAAAELPIPIPPVAEQEELLSRIAGIFGLVEAIQNRVSDAMLRADKLTQSILAKAFRGELVPTEAELARREGREYEPASVLLERIRAERADKARAPAGGKRTPRKASAHV